MEPAVEASEGGTPNISDDDDTAAAADVAAAPAAAASDAALAEADAAAGAEAGAGWGRLMRCAGADAAVVEVSPLLMEAFQARTEGLMLKALDGGCALNPKP